MKINIYLKLILVFVILAFLVNAVFGANITPLPASLLQEMNQVEASGRISNVPKGDNGLARGPMQIHFKYWQDAIQYDKTIGGTYADCDGYAYSVKVVTAYLNRYGKAHITSGNYEALARIHNGGPSGYKNQSTVAYWRKYKFASVSGTRGKG